MAAIPYVDGESVQQNLDRVRTYFELLNMPFEVSQNKRLFLLGLSLAFFYSDVYIMFYRRYLHS